MVSNKMLKLKEDLSEVKDKFDNVGIENTMKDLKEAIEMLELDLNEHIEVIENLVCDIR